MLLRGEAFERVTCWQFRGRVLGVRQRRSTLLWNEALGELTTWQNGTPVPRACQPYWRMEWVSRVVENVRSRDEYLQKETKGLNKQRHIFKA